MNEFQKPIQAYQGEQDYNDLKHPHILTKTVKWDAEQRFKEQEINLKEQDQACKEAEIKLKRKEQAASGWKKPLVLVIMAATVAAAGNAAITITNVNLQRELEDQKSNKPE